MDEKCVDIGFWVICILTIVRIVLPLSVLAIISFLYSVLKNRSKNKKKPLTMNELYKDGSSSDHIACMECGQCITCDTCDCTKDDEKKE